MLYLFFLLLGDVSASIVKPSTSAGNFELLILHNNDMHARFEQTSQLSGACAPADRDAGKCYGGFPRVAHVVKEARKAAASGEGPPVLYLNAGDTYTGTAWFTIYKWKVAAEFLNALQPDAVSLGNNDIEGTKLAPFLENLNAPILTSNIKVQSDAAHKIKRSVIIDIDGAKVGIIGYLSLDFNVLDKAGSIEYNDEVIILKEEVEKLQSEGVNIIIALGHSDVSKNFEIAKEVEGLDLIISGHKNAFFWNGTNAENDAAYEPLKIVKQKSGKEVPIVESYAYNKYLGKVIAKFDSEGEITELKSDPILLDATIPQDAAASQILQKYNDQIDSIEVVGNTAVVLDGETCKTEECNFGNLVLDSIIQYYAVRFTGERWTDAAIAIMHGGALATRIAPPNRPAAVTRNDLLSALPETDNLVAVTITGQELLQLLEHSVADFNLNNPSGQFLQFSGIRVTYDLSKDPGSRVVSVVARCWSCFVPEFYTIDDWRDYKIIMPLSLATGGYGYSMLVGKPRETLAYDAFTCTSEYMGLRSPVYPDVAGRVTFLNIDATTEPTIVDPTTADPTTLAPTTLPPTTLEPTTEPSPDSASSITSTLTMLCFTSLIYMFV